MDIMKISNFNVGEKKVFVIAEIGNNHNGSFELALEMVDAAHDAGANCVKFQMRNMSSVYRKKSLAKQGEDLGTEYVLDLLERFQLSQSEHKQVAQYCEDKGILYMCTPWDSDSIVALEALDVKAYKVASRFKGGANSVYHREMRFGARQGHVTSLHASRLIAALLRFPCFCTSAKLTTQFIHFALERLLARQSRAIEVVPHTHAQQHSEPAVCTIALLHQ